MGSLAAFPWRNRKAAVGFYGTVAFLTLILTFWHHTERGQYTVGTANTPKPPKTHIAPKAPLIPQKIWQIWFQQDGAAEHYLHNPQLRETATWVGMNSDHQYRLVGRSWGDNYVQQHFNRAADKDLVDTYLAVRNHGLKSDLLRYLILYNEGGVYSDIDTIAMKPIKDWVPRHLRDTVKLVVGIEFDRRDGGMWSEIPHDLQFCQWTIAAAPGHLVFRAMADRALASLHKLTVAYDTTMAELKPTSFETMNSTGPAAWTDVVFEQIQQARPGITTLANLSRIQEPQLYGDILVLGIDGFGMGQPHSGATNDGSIPEAALVKHLFRGSWRNS
ncbi:glycosyltransferase family 32 protein [Apiospora marii]|uniref:Glycosyltransferase family 32 protein n=1 Tax=Apiospora marii TaxID=335849 RepID=A0ABR1RUE4_9PEZI